MLMILFLSLPIVRCSRPEIRLREKLMQDYNALERPVKNYSDKVVITLGIALQQIISLNEKEERLEMIAWPEYHWNDPKLKWNPEEYDNITKLGHPFGSVWQPDILLYNSVDSSFDSTYKVDVVNYNNGDMTWNPPGILKVACKIDIYWFPFDEQICFFKFGAWTYNGAQLDLQEGQIALKEYLESGEWALLKAWAVRTEDNYGLAESYPDIKIYMRLRRRTLYYAFNLIMPCMLTLILIVLGFTLSPQSCEKVGLQISVSLAIIIFLTIVNNMTPPTSEAVPLLGVFFHTCVYISVAATAFTVYVQAIHFRDPENSQRMGFWMHFLLLEFIPYILAIKRPRRKNNWNTIKESWRNREKYDPEEGYTSLHETKTIQSSSLIKKALRENFQNLMFQLETREQTQKTQISLQRIKVLNRIYNHVKALRKGADDESEVKSIGIEYQFAALVFDRLCLVVFSTIMILTTVINAARAPYLFA